MSKVPKNSDTLAKVGAEAQRHGIDPNRAGIPRHLRAGYAAYLAAHCRRVLILTVFLVLAAYTLVLPMDYFFSRTR